MRGPGSTALHLCRLQVLWQKGGNRWQKADGTQILLCCGQYCTLEAPVEGSAET